MLQKATRLMAEEIPHGRWREVVVRVTSTAVEMFRDSVSSSHRAQHLRLQPTRKKEKWTEIHMTAYTLLA